MLSALSPGYWLAFLVLAFGFLLRFNRHAALLGWWERPLARLARRKKFAILLNAAMPLLIRALLLPSHPAPEPRVHDEFTLLLGADTFAQGRVVNSPHPFWVHFESMHLLTKPVYASAFPAAPSLVLAMGKVLFGHPWAGVWISIAFMGGAICWMLQGWLPPRWALLGGLLAGLNWGVSSYWMNSYWGGSLAAGAGALALGALPRIKSGNWNHAFTFAFALAILANSRPFEGAVFGLILLLPIWLWMRSELRRFVLPVALVLAITAAAMGYYFHSVTGKPWLLPYVLYRSTLSVAPHFIWQNPRPEPPYNSYEMRRFYVDSEMNNYFTSRNSLLLSTLQKIQHYLHFYLPPLFLIPMVAALFGWRDHRMRMFLLMAAAFSFPLLLEVWDQAHYAAPATGLAVLLVTSGLRNLRIWPAKGRVGLIVARLIPAAIVTMLLIQIAALPGDESWRWASSNGTFRAQILQRLQATPGMHLVFVRYDRAHDSGNEWVYNDAEIDASKVVWARELDRASNAKLQRYFPARNVWLAEPDLPLPAIRPFHQAPPRPMPFVAIGAPGIDVLRSPQQLRQQLSPHATGNYNCDQWNYIFAELTGVAGPDANRGCYSSGHRGDPVSFDHWFAWLLIQR